MRTRRSPRNQEILFRQLFAPELKKAERQERIYTDDEIDALPISKPAKAAMRREMQAKRVRRALKKGP